MKPRSLPSSSSTVLTKSFQPAAAFFAGVLAFTANSSLEAASATWNGGVDTEWSTEGNWSAAPVPGFGDTATFSNSTAGTAQTITADGMTVANIIFDTANAAAYTLGGGTPALENLYLNPAGAVTMNATVARNQLINSNLVLGAIGAYSVTNNSLTNTLSVAGSIFASSGGLSTLTLGGAGNTTVSGLITNASGTVGLVKNDAGVVTLSGDLSHTGTNIINAGTLVLSGNNTQTGALVLNNGGTLQLQANVNNTTAGVSNAIGAQPAGFQFSNGNGGSALVQLRGDTSVTFGNTTTGSFTGSTTLNFDVNNLTSGTNQTLSFGALGTFNTTINVSGGNGYTLALAGISNANGAALNLNANTADLTVGDIPNLGGVGLTIGGAASTTVTGIISAGAITKIGAGTATLSGANTTTGATVVRTGVLNLSGSAKTGSSLFVVNNNAASTTSARVNISSDYTANQSFLGDRAGAGQLGAIYQTAGNVIFTQAAGIDNLRIGSVGGGHGYYNISGGSLTANRPAIGGSLADTVGVVEVTGGLFASNEQMHVAAGSATSSGLLNVTGGSATAVTDLRFFQLQAGTAGATQQAVANVGGGLGVASITTGNSATLGVNLAQSGNVLGQLGALNLLPNGTLNTGRILGSQANPTTHFNFNGGTLRATSANAGTIFADATLDAVNVYSGGGTINNNGTAITINRGLLAPAGQGLSGATIAVPSGGSGYVGSPLVKITGGTGRGATGYAVVTGGAVTSIVVTSPGINFTAGDTLTASFFGGGPAVAATTVTGIPVAPNTSGGMTFAGSGTGTTTLSATNTYTGPTSVSTGRVTLTGTLASAVTVSSAATIGGTGSTSGLLTLNGGSTLALPGTSTSVSLTSNGVNFAGSTALTFDTAPVAGTYDVIKYGAGGVTSLGNLSAGAIRAVIANDVANQKITAAVSTGTRTWNVTNGTWEYGGPGTNWLEGDQKFYAGDTVIFNNPASPSVVTLTGLLTPSSVTVTNTNNYTFSGSGAIIGATGLNKSGTGALTLATANTYSAGTTLNDGTLNLNNATAIGTGALTIAGGVLDATNGATTLTTNNAQNWNADIAFAGTNNLNLGTGAVTLGASRIVTTNNAASLTVGGIISGTAMSLTKNGSGTLVLGGANTYNGGTTINTGTLQLTQTAGAAATGIINLAGGTFQINQAGNNFGYGPALNFTAPAVFSNIGAGLINYTGTLVGGGNAVSINTGAARMFMNGATSGVAQFNVTAGAMGFDLNAGNRGGGAPVVVSNGAALWLASATAILANNLTFNGGNGLAGNGALFMEGAGSPIVSGSVSLAGGDSSFGGNNAASNVSITGPISGPGSLTKIGVAKFTLAGNNTYSATTTVNVGTLAAGVTSVPNVSGAFGNNSAVVIANTAGATLDITGFNTQIGSITGGGAAGGNVTLGGATLTTGGDNTSPAAYAGVISGTGALTKIGGGTQTLTGLSTYTGNTTVNGGTLIANRANNFVNPVNSALGNPQVARDIIVNTGGTLNLAEGDTFGGSTSVVQTSLVINPGGLVTNSVNRFNTLGPVLLNGGTLTTLGGAILGFQSFSFSGNVTVGGSVASTISVTGDGNDYNGFHLGTTTNFNVADVTSSAASDLTVTAPLINRPALLGGAGGFIKAGAGTMTLGAVNTYTGNTVVTGGTLVLDTAAEMRFVIGTNTVSNSLSGAGAATLKGDFSIDLTGANLTDGNSWVLVNMGETYDASFNVVGFTKVGTTHTLVDGGNTWIYTESDGTLRLEIGGYETWALANAGGEDPDGDHDNDGVENGVEYFMGETGSTFTPNPSLVGGTVTWPKDPNYSGTFTVQTSPDLVIWSPQTSIPVGNTITYTPANNLGKVFIRLLVKPN